MKKATHKKKNYTQEKSYTQEKRQFLFPINLLKRLCKRCEKKNIILFDGKSVKVEEKLAEAILKTRTKVKKTAEVFPYYLEKKSYT